MSDLERVLKVLRRRDWQRMRASWIDQLSLVDDLSNAEVSLSEITDVSAIFQNMLKERKQADEELKIALSEFEPETTIRRHHKVIKLTAQAIEKQKRDFEINVRRNWSAKIGPWEAEIAPVRIGLFQEGVKLAQKALHVLGCAESNASNGMPSWSLCSGYQAALFASKAILAFCGIGLIDIDSKTLVADIFPESPVETGIYTHARFSIISTRLDHRAVWQLFQRIIGITTSCHCWPSEAVDKIKIVEEAYFAKQRNDVHYKNTFWPPLNDLYQFCEIDAFGQTSNWGISAADIDVDRPDISLVIGLYLVKMAVDMFKDLGTISNLVQNEVERFSQCCHVDRHPIYHGILG